MQAVTISEERGHEFEWEQGEMYERVWRGEREVRNVIILKITKVKI